MPSPSILGMNWVLGQLELAKQQDDEKPKPVSNRQWSMHLALMFLANSRKLRITRNRRCLNCKLALREYAKSRKP